VPKVPLKVKNMVKMRFYCQKKPLFYKEKIFERPI